MLTLPHSMPNRFMLPSIETALCAIKSCCVRLVARQETMNGKTLKKIFSYIIRTHKATHVSTGCSTETVLRANTGDTISTHMRGAQIHQGLLACLLYFHNLLINHYLTAPYTYPSATCLFQRADYINTTREENRYGLGRVSIQAYFYFYCMQYIFNAAK
jgi:hypothetical protein